MKKQLFRVVTSAVMTLLLCMAAATAVGAADARFTDVPEGIWYAKAVDYVADKGIMVGTDDSVFAPDLSFTRAMTVQVLSMISGDDLTGYTEADFPDVPTDAWFTTAVAWAADKGVAAGDGVNFNPNDMVTREQLACMVHRFAEKYDVTNMFAVGPDSTDGFDDSEAISSWAQDSISWAVHNGLISGTGENNLSPTGTATRSQAAQIFYYFNFMKTDRVLPPDTTDFDKITVKESDEVRFICWGDSMTQGYPSELMKISGVVTRNFSAGGDTAEHIAMKQGAMPLYVEPFTIPDSTESVKIVLRDENYDPVISMADLGVAGINPAYVAGIKGRVFYKAEDDSYYFSRMDKAPFKEVQVNRLTRVVTMAMNDQRTGDVHIIFSGPSNEYDSTEAHKLIKTQERMIDYMASDKYIIISLTALYYMDNIWDFNADLAEHYGDNFLDFRSYVLDRGLQDLGLEPTEQDLADIAIGEIPSSLRVDHEHGNEYYHLLLAQQVYKKIIEMGYFTPAE